MINSCRAIFRRCFSAHSGRYPPRTHNCGALRARDEGNPVVLAGWILPQRKISNSLSFFSVRDAIGTTQLVASRNSDDSARTLDNLAAIPVESVVLIEGSVRLRPQNARRKSEPTGDVEVLVQAVTLLNPAQHALMPFLPSDSSSIPNEELRSRFRHLDFRRPGSGLAANIRRRSAAAHIVRNYLHDQEFVEVETPLLLKTTPEGAREFLVPTRVGQPTSVSSSQDTTQSPISHDLQTFQSGMTCQPLFYTLPQSPQQPKQLLVASGAVERYYQLARCFRDEDGRRDRQPEFTQIDIEMAFADWGCSPEISGNADWRIGGSQVRKITEELVRRVWKKIANEEVPHRFPVMPYHDAIGQYGSDKPDTRFALQIKDMTPYLPDPLRNELASNHEICECLVVRARGGKEVEGDVRFIQASRNLKLEEGDGVESFVLHNEQELESWFHRCTTLHHTQKAGDTPTPITIDINKLLHISVGDTIFISRRHWLESGGSTTLGRVRTRIAEEAEVLGSYSPPSTPHFLWVTEFPLFSLETASHGKGMRWSSTHHPFTAPIAEHVQALLNGAVGTVLGQHYDLVLNGVEIGGGSVRVHDADMQEYIFSKVLKLSENEKASFDHLLHALRSGAPPHAGIALGFDRMMAILCGTSTIRDVIAFPKTGSGTDALFKSPSPVGDDVLAQYGIRAR